MKVFEEVRAAVVSTVVLAVVCCGFYPLVVFAIGQAVFRDKANGSLIVDAQGTVRGSMLLAQGFEGSTYFHPRPSAAGSGYDAANSCGSNLGPTSQKLADAIRDRIAAYRETNGLNATEPVPADAVTASASGLDPHISLRNAELQLPRVAKARGLGEGAVRELLDTCIDAPDMGVLGVAGVNVLRLNLALDGVK